MLSTKQTPGQAAYERDLALLPFGPDGKPRLKWADLDAANKNSWEDNPNVHTYVNARKVFSDFDFDAVEQSCRNDMQRFVKYASEIGEQLIRKKVGEVAILLNRKVIFLSTDEKNELVVCISKDPARFERDWIEFSGQCIRVKYAEDLIGHDLTDDIRLMQLWLRSRVSVSFKQKKLRVLTNNTH